jgi:hypothetical protein
LLPVFSDIICRLCVGSNFNSPQKLLKYYRLLHFEEHRHGNFSLKSSANFLEFINKALILPIKTILKRIHRTENKEINLRFETYQMKNS